MHRYARLCPVVLPDACVGAVLARAPCVGRAHFKTAAFVHSATPPNRDSIAGLLGPHALRYLGRIGHDWIKLADVG
jgi:hypothetical protein